MPHNFSKIKEKLYNHVFKAMGRGYSFSEALILASVNPQYDKRFFIAFPEKCKFRTCCVQKLSFKTIFVHNMYFVFWGEFNEQSLVI